jgi:hypothetical protein
MARRAIREQTLALTPAPLIVGESRIEDPQLCLTKLLPICAG